MSTATGQRPVAEVFAALGDPHRQDLLETLAAHARGASATTLAATRPVSRQAVDKHLRVLQRAGLVEATRSGRQVLYAVRQEELARSAAWLTALAARWDQRLAVIKTAAEDRATGAPSDVSAEGTAS